MKLSFKIIVCTLLSALTFSIMASDPSNGNSRIIRLTGFQETPPLLTSGKGYFKWEINKAASLLSYTLTFSDLSGQALVAHIHFGHANSAGPAIVFLCGGSKPACPADGGTISGTVQASDVLAVPAQGLAAGDFAGFLSILANGKGYVNVHTSQRPAGEIRGQIRMRK